MDDQGHPPAVLNIYELVDGGGVQRHLVCFLDPVLAGVRGIDPRSVIGEFTPAADQEFDPETFLVNPDFTEAFTGYMNEEAVRSPDIHKEALGHASGSLYILDPRSPVAEGKEPDAGDLLGCFAVDDAGQIVNGSFHYNEMHQWFNRATGVSGVLSDRRFYDWLHAPTGPGGSSRSGPGA